MCPHQLRLLTAVRPQSPVQVRRKVTHGYVEVKEPLLTFTPIHPLFRVISSCTCTVLYLRERDDGPLDISANAVDGRKHLVHRVNPDHAFASEVILFERTGLSLCLTKRKRQKLCALDMRNRSRSTWTSRTTSARGLQNSCPACEVGKLRA